MKIIIEHYGVEISIKLADDEVCDEVIYRLAKLLCLDGYAISTVIDSLHEAAHSLEAEGVKT